MKKLLKNMRKRSELKKQREELTGKDVLSDKIAEAFLLSELYKNSDTLLLYYSVGSEVGTKEIFHAALKDVKRVAFPVCVDGNGFMEFYYVSSEADLAEGMYGIKEPRKDCEKYDFKNQTYKSFFSNFYQFFFIF